MSSYPPIPEQITPAPVVPGVWDLSISIVHAFLIADGDAPHTPGGCPFQAWSLGELMRAEALLGTTTAEGA